MFLPPVRRRFLLSATLVAGLVLVLGGPPALGWYDKVHVYTIQQALDLIRRFENGRDGPYSELFDSEFARALGKGGSDEDWGAVQGNERSFRHYYDPDAPDGHTGVRFYEHYWLWHEFEDAAVTKPPSGYYEGALEWAVEPSVMTGNMDGWQAAIDSYSDTEASRWVAYYRLGHVGHLLADMSESDHTRVFPHPGSGFVMPDKLWQAAGRPEYTRIDGVLASGDDLTQQEAWHLWALRMALELVQAVQKDTYPAAFGPTLSIGRVGEGRWTGYEGLIEDQVHPDLVRHNFTPEAGARRLRPMLTDTRPEVPFAGGGAPVRLDDVPDYFNTLARRTNEVTAQHGLEKALALGLADLQPYLDQNASLVVRDASATWLRYRGFKGEPIYAIPTINVYDDEAKRPFYNLAFPLLGDATEYVAGLFELFHDIVSPPPFVRSVRIQQRGATVYHAAWKDELETRNADSQPWGPLAGTGTYDVVTGREFVRDTDEVLDPDSPATIIVEFGPSARNARLHPAIDAMSIRVSVGSAVARGFLLNADTWQGEFVPSPGTTQSPGEQPIYVLGSDSRRHYPRDGLPQAGYRLDVNPGTVARPATTKPYDWTGYEPGADRNHKVRVGQMAVPLPPTPTEPPSPTAQLQPAQRSYSFIGQLDQEMVTRIVARYQQSPVRIQSTPVQGRVANGVVTFSGPIVYEASETAPAINQVLHNRKTYTLESGTCGYYGWCRGKAVVDDESSVTGQPGSRGRVTLDWQIGPEERTRRLVFSIANGRPPSWGDIPYVLSITEER